MDAETFVDGAQLCGKGVDKAELPGDPIAEIAQHLVFEKIIQQGCLGPVRRLRRDGHERSAERPDLGQNLLVSPQLQAAVRSPRPAVERHHCRSSGKQVVEAHLFSHGIGEGEIRRLGSLLQGSPGNARPDQLLS